METKQKNIVTWQRGNLSYFRGKKNEKKGRGTYFDMSNFDMANFNMTNSGLISFNKNHLDMTI